MGIVIGLKGLIGSGKTTVARYLIEKHGFTRGRFAGALKEMMRALLRYRGCTPAEIDRMIDGDLKEKPTVWLQGKSPREAMEALGNGWGRDLIHPNLWIASETDRLWCDQPERIVFEDARHPNEAAAIRETMGGHICEVYRPGLKPKDHITEHSQAAIIPCRCILNADGNLKSTFAQLDEMVAALAGGDVCCPKQVPMAANG